MIATASRQARQAVTSAGHAAIIASVTSREASPGSGRTCRATLTRVYLYGSNPASFEAVHRALAGLSGAYSTVSRDDHVAVYRACDPAQA